MKAKGGERLFHYRRLISAALYGGGTVLLLLLQTAPRLFPSILGVRPSLLVLFAVCAALFEGASTGMVVGLVSGLLWDVFSPQLFGLHGLMLMVIGLVCGALVENIFRANLWAAWLLSTGAALLHALGEWFFCYHIFAHPDRWALLYRIYLPNVGYTVLLAPVIFWLTKLLAQLARRIRKA